MIRLPVSDMHTEVSSKDGKPTYFATSNRGTLIMGARADEGLICGQDYSSFVFDDDDEEKIVLTSYEEDVEDGDASTIGKLLKKGKGIPSHRKNVGQSSSAAVKDASKDLDPPAS
ncbi:hypothetical protein ACOSP7_016977 [Xanthoceras sorbifolium]